MRLIIMRHAEAEPNFMNDDARRLTARGIGQAQAQAKLLMTLMPSIDVMAVSPLIRTQQTADNVEQYVDVTNRIAMPELVHSRTAQEAETQIATLRCDNLLLVSHMPLVASLESYLTGAARSEGFGLAEVSVLESADPYPGNWQRLSRYSL